MPNSFFFFFFFIINCNLYLHIKVPGVNNCYVKLKLSGVRCIVTLVMVDAAIYKLKLILRMTQVLDTVETELNHCTGQHTGK